MGKLSGQTTALAPRRGSKKVARNRSVAKPKEGGPIKVKQTATYGSGLNTFGTKSELYMTAISTFAGEDTFYETGQARIERVRNLVWATVEKDPEWLQRFIPWLRGPEVNIRTIALIIAAEYVAADGPDGASVIDSVCQRADEPAEILAYWMQYYYGWDGVSYPLPSPKLPQALRKGLARAVCRLWNQYSVMKYNGNSRGVNMAHVLNLVHPAVKDYPSSWDQERVDEQRALFKYIIDKEYGNKTKLKKLKKVKNQSKIKSYSPEEVRALTSAQLEEAGITWEQYSGYISGPMNASAWERVIPNMGYMALLRNLRNFEAAGIDVTTRREVIEKLTDPAQVRKSRQLPFRFLSAYRACNSAQYLQALEDALELSIQNIPSFDGSTLVMLDKSGSMDNTVSENSSMKRWEVGAVFATALERKGEDVDLGIFGNFGKVMHIPAGAGILSGVKHLQGNHGVGHGTAIWPSTAELYDNHNRVIIFTDMQHNAGSGQRIAQELSRIPNIHFFNLAGYEKSAAPSNIGEEGRFYYGGFSDATFKMMLLLEEQNKAGWPF